MTDPKPAILSLPAADLEAWLVANDAPAYRRRQVWGWIARGAAFDEMHDIPKSLRTDLARDFRSTSLRTITNSEADRALTSKTLYELDGGHSVEAVVMRYADRSTLCISSQAGCPIGCPFCATGKFPFGRNLKAHEIVEQATDAARLLAGEGRRLSHVVFMGMGEPMANYQSVIDSVRRIADPELLGISPRRIVVSTSGLIPRIEQLAGEKLPVTLAISLHAARDELRNVLVPINRKYPVVGSGQSIPGLRGDHRPAGQLRMGAARWRQRHRARCEGAGQVVATQACAREPDPIQPGRGHPVSRSGPRCDQALQRDGRRAGVERDSARYPRARSRRRVRPAARTRHARTFGYSERCGPRTVGGRVIGGTLYAGTSGFSYASWKGVFYPANLPGSRMLEYYSQRLNGVELNGSFYRTPPESTLLSWAAGTSQEFRFCMKAHRGLTYSADAFDRVGLATIIGERLAPLGDRLGPVLLQFPPARQRNVALLDGLLSALGRPVAAEFRHESWFDEDTYRTLRTHAAALVVTDEEKWPRAPFEALGPIAYFRLRRGYDSQSLKPWLADVKAAIASHDQVHVYFKHDPEAPALAEQLLQSAG